MARFGRFIFYSRFGWTLWCSGQEKVLLLMVHRCKHDPKYETWAALSRTISPLWSARRFELVVFDGVCLLAPETELMWDRADWYWAAGRPAFLSRWTKAQLSVSGPVMDHGVSSDGGCRMLIMTVMVLCFGFDYFRQKAMWFFPKCPVVRTPESFLKWLQ